MLLHETAFAILEWNSQDLTNPVGSVRDQLGKQKHRHLVVRSKGTRHAAHDPSTPSWNTDHMTQFNTLRCGRRPGEKDCLLSDLKLSLEEEIALTITRLFLKSFASPDSHAWVAALAEAEARFGFCNGPVVAARILAALQTIRQTRRSVFMFNSPTCPGCAALATEHERRLMTALSAIGRDDIGSARIEVMMLCEGNGCELVLTALSALACVLRGDLPQNTRPTHHTVVTQR